ncbi:MAG TPA: hypothetical protein VM617_08005 [Thermoanaerobaculia bacterium]|nr:hypothetical protein [Thermoanaerobaculia bacterium]
MKGIVWKGSAEQIARYDELRGYGGGDPAQHQPSENRGHDGHHGHRPGS